MVAAERKVVVGSPDLESPDHEPRSARVPDSAQELKRISGSGWLTAKTSKRTKQPPRLHFWHLQLRSPAQDPWNYAWGRRRNRAGSLEFRTRRGYDSRLPAPQRRCRVREGVCDSGSVSCGTSAACRSDSAVRVTIIKNSQRKDLRTQLIALYAAVG